MLKNSVFGIAGVNLTPLLLQNFGIVVQIVTTLLIAFYTIRALREKKKYYSRYNHNPFSLDDYKTK